MNPKDEIKELTRELESERAQRKAAEARVAELNKWFGENRISICTVKELREAEARASAAEAQGINAAAQLCLRLREEEGIGLDATYFAKRILALLPPTKESEST